MALPPCRTLQNVIQTQTCESCQLNKLSTLHALSCRRLSTRSTCLEARAPNMAACSTVMFLTTTNKLNIQTQNNICQLFACSFICFPPIIRCSSFVAGFYHVFHGIEQPQETMCRWISEDDLSTSTWIVRWTVHRIDHNLFQLFWWVSSNLCLSYTSIFKPTSFRCIITPTSPSIG